MSSYEETLKKLNLIVPQASTPVGSYRPVILSGNLAFLSGQISKRADGTLITGKVGKDVTVEQAKEAARVCALNVISIIQHLIGFQKFQKFVRIVGYVQTVPEFNDHSSVTNGASDLFLEVFGEKGIHARSSIGMASLPLNAAVEIEATLEIRP
jgi:enamine deaminase RidA (YjgF/YER057c/UK114 family)